MIRDTKLSVSPSRYPGERLTAWRISEANINDDVKLVPGEMQALIAFMEVIIGRVDERYLSN